jgi:xylan 1,4-beta-xylosidase
LAVLCATAGAASDRRVTPLLDVPLRDTAITRGPDGTYYLTGTSGPDFDNNDGIYLWKSSDLRKWEALGRVWNFVAGTERMVNRESRGPKHWLLNPRVVDQEPPRLGRGIRAPKLCFVDGQPWLVISVNGNNCGVLVAEKRAVTGPYRFTGIDGDVLMGDGSVFQDADGTVFLVWGPGYIAAVAAAKDRLVLPAQMLTGRAAGWPNRAAPFKQKDARGPQVLRTKDGEYLLFYNARTIRDQREHHDLLMCRAASVWGPYSGPRLALADADGGASVFQDEAGQLMAVASDAAGQLRLAKLAPQ